MYSAEAIQEEDLFNGKGEDACFFQTFPGEKKDFSSY